jgi:hypothetical protein
MRLNLFKCLPMLCVAGFTFAPTAYAQTDGGLLIRARAGNPSGERFWVDSAGGVYAFSQMEVGDPLRARGSGGRMTWLPYKNAFRAGYVEQTRWDNEEVGFYSFAVNYNTTAPGGYSAAFGLNSRAIGDGSFAVGNSTASGQYAVTLGVELVATHNYSTAIGYCGTSDHNAALVISLASGQNAVCSALGTLTSSAADQMTVRAGGGYRFYTNTAMTTGAQLLPNGTAWTFLSDRNSKTKFAAIDVENILQRVAALPMSEWQYKGEQIDGRHIGPMAQDWQAAFHLNDNDLGINSADFDGINLAAIQALEKRTRRLHDEHLAITRELKRQNDRLHRELNDVKARLERLEKLL